MTVGLDKLICFDQMGYKPHKGQRMVHIDSARMKAVTAGRRLGKSVIGAHELSVEALLTYSLADELKKLGIRREFWIVGPEYSDSEKEFRILWDDLERMQVPLDHPGSYNSPWNGEMEISAFDGRFQVKAKSAKYPGTLVGEGLSGVILAEAAKLKPVVWHKMIRPTLADYRGWMLATSTPEGRNWFYDLFMRGQDPDDSQWSSWRMPSWMNPIVFPKGASEEGIKLIRSVLNDPDQKMTQAIIEASGVDDEIVDMARDMTEERFDQEIAAKFTEFVGRVFKDFDETIHVQDVMVNPDLPIYLATDSGWSNPFVALAIQVDHWDNVYVLADYRKQQTDIEDIATELQTARGGIFAAARKHYGDPGAPGDAAILSKKLKVTTQGGTGGDLKWRLELIRQALKLRPDTVPFEDRKPKLVFSRSVSEQTIFEFSDGYRYPDTKKERQGEAPEQPMKKDDHAPEALGRFFVGHFGGPSDSGETNGRAVVNTAKVSA
jgi:hypothetical protein